MKNRSFVTNTTMDDLRLAVEWYEAAADKIEATEMVDPKQNVDHQSGTMSQQLHLALQTIETEFSVPDGSVITHDDVQKVTEALGTIRKIVDDVETRLAATMVQNNEKPRSKP